MVERLCRFGPVGKFVVQLQWAALGLEACSVNPSGERVTKLTILNPQVSGAFMLC